MRTRCVQVLACVIAGAACSELLAGEHPFVPHQALVRLTPGASIAAFNATYGTTSLAAIPARNIHLIGLPLKQDEAAFVDSLATNPSVVYADLNFIADEQPAGGSTQSLFFEVQRGAYDADVTPTVVNAPAAWTTATGAGIVVAVLDTGIDAAHTELASRIVAGGFNYVDGNANVADTTAGVDSNGNQVVDEFFGHGTLVAGLIARIAPDARLLPIKIMDSDGISTSFRLTQGIYHAIDAGASVINISLGTPADPNVLRDAALEAESRGVLIVAAAGNDDSADPRYPGGLSSLGVIGVATTDSTAVRAGFTNYGPWITLSAPGVDVVSTVPGDRYGRASGTSLSAPIVAGAAAVIRSGCPITTADEIRGLLASGSTPINLQNPSYVGQLGAGLVNVGDAAQLALAPGSPCRCDRNNDSIVNIEDLYEIHIQMIDANGDGAANWNDPRDLESWLRRFEYADFNDGNR